MLEVGVRCRHDGNMTTCLAQLVGGVDVQTQHLGSNPQGGEFRFLFILEDQVFLVLLAAPRPRRRQGPRTPSAASSLLPPLPPAVAAGPVPKVSGRVDVADPI